MAGKRKHHTAAFKAQVALATLKADRTVNELAAQHSVHPTLIHTWKKQLLAGAETVFANGVRVEGVDSSGTAVYDLDLATVLINKIDLLPYVDFDLDVCAANARSVNPRVQVLPVSATTGEGIESWYQWIDVSVKV